jgi:hypothetical protein
MGKARAAVFPDFNGMDHVQTELCQIRQVFISKASFLQMGMDKPEALKPAGMDPSPLQLRDVDACCSPGDDICHRPEAVDENADLDADLMGKMGELRGELMGYREIRGNFPPVESFERSDLRCLQPLYIPVDLQSRAPRS